MDVYEVRPRKDRRSVDLISDALPFGRNRLATREVLRCLVPGRELTSMETAREPRYSVYVVLLDEYVATLPQMRRRNPKRDPSKPCVYVGLTPLRVDRRFDFRRASPETEWRVHKFGVRLMPELYKHFNPITPERALQTARKLAEDLASQMVCVTILNCTNLGRSSR